MQCMRGERESRTVRFGCITRQAVGEDDRKLPHHRNIRHNWATGTTALCFPESVPSRFSLQVTLSLFCLLSYTVMPSGAFSGNH